jgi:hypothetical protein
MNPATSSRKSKRRTDLQFGARHRIVPIGSEVKAWPK